MVRGSRCPLETLLPQLQPADLWERSGRWQGYTAGEGIMFHWSIAQDRSNGGSRPPMKEVVTALAARPARSTRQLPVCYRSRQISATKIRPPFGADACT